MLQQTVHTCLTRLETHCMSRDVRTVNFVTGTVSRYGRMNLRLPTVHATCVYHHLIGRGRRVCGGVSGDDLLLRRWNESCRPRLAAPPGNSSVVHKLGKRDVLPSHDYQTSCPRGSNSSSGIEWRFRCTHGIPGAPVQPFVVHRPRTCFFEGLVRYAEFEEV